MKYNASFFKIIIYIKMHDGIDFDGFNNLTLEKKYFLTAIFICFDYVL